MPENTPDAPVEVQPEPLDPQSIDQILVDLKGFGIVDTEQIITIEVKQRKVNLRLTNLSVDDEIQSLIANLELKGHVWVHQMRCDLLSRAISWINGATITDDTFAKDPKTGEDRPIRPLLRDLLLRWGDQVILVLFKTYMVHCQKVEDNLTEQLPDSVVLTDVERRFMQQVTDQLKAIGISAVSETLDAATSDVPESDLE